MADSLYFKKAKNQSAGRWSDVYQPIYRKDGTITNGIKKYDDDDIRNLLDEKDTHDFTNITNVLVKIRVVTPNKTYWIPCAEICAEDSAQVYTIKWDGVYYSVLKSATTFFELEE